MGFCHLQLQDFCLVVFDTNEFSSLHSQLLNAIAILQIIMGYFLGEIDVPSLTLRMNGQIMQCWGCCQVEIRRANPWPPKAVASILPSLPDHSGAHPGSSRGAGEEGKKD